MPFQDDNADKIRLLSLSEESLMKESRNDSSDSFNIPENFKPSHYEKQLANHTAVTVPELFIFDPNTLSFEGWKKLGIKDKTIHTIQNYLQKGGKFVTAEDISKIYGMNPQQTERLIPWIKIKSIPGKDKSFPGKSFGPVREQYKEQTDIAPKGILDINSADSVSLVKLPGIGPRLASRIINFRNKLGGFYAVDQVAETYGLPDSTFQKIKPGLTVDGTIFRRIDINSSDLKQLILHPYINYNLANVILQYRSQHGKFKEVDDLKKIETISPGQFKKLAPYLLAQ